MWHFSAGILWCRFLSFPFAELFGVGVCLLGIRRQDFWLPCAVAPKPKQGRASVEPLIQARLGQGGDFPNDGSAPCSFCSWNLPLKPGSNKNLFWVLCATGGVSLVQCFSKCASAWGNWSNWSSGCWPMLIPQHPELNG